MIKLFISQPMNGKTDEEILAERDRAMISAAKSLGDTCLVLDSFVQGAPAEARPLWYLGKSLEVLSEADVAVFVRGWDKARGCRIEHLCAEEYGIVILEESPMQEPADGEH
jgi:hypothetical protein